MNIVKNGALEINLSKTQVLIFNKPGKVRLKASLA
jgi:hypothetical protein